MKILKKNFKILKKKLQNVEKKWKVWKTKLQNFEKKFEKNLQNFQKLSCLHDPKEQP